MTQPSFDFGQAPSGAPVDETNASGQETMSIGEAVKRLNDVLHDGLGGLVWVRGEIHNAKVSRGNRFFDLVDDARGAADVRQRPKLSASLWSQTYQRVSSKLERAGVRLAEGLCVRMRGSFEVYGPTGRLGFRVVDVDPEFTAGHLAIQRDELMKRLAGEGLLEANTSVPMALVPLRVGVVTSLGSEGWRDFRTNLDESGIGFRLQLAKAVLQGANAPIQVSRALRRLSERQDLDVIAVVRGGGSKSDLATFDHEYVARAIAASPIPVLTGIGHDNDRSVADEVAHTSCKTPTACAQKLIDLVRAFEHQLDERGARVHVLAGAALGKSRHRLVHASRELTASTRRTLGAVGAQLVTSHGRARRAATRSLRDGSRRLDTNTAQVRRAVPAALSRAQHHVDLVAAKVAAVDPGLALARGWSITTINGRLVRGVSDVEAGAEITTRLYDGQFTSTVHGVKPDHRTAADAPSRGQR